MPSATLKPVAIAVCGTSGAGKSTVGERLASVLQCPFEEGDHFHSKENIEKMKSGTALTDADRMPWLHRIREEVIVEYVEKRKKPVVLACSALKHEYRDILRGQSTGDVSSQDPNSPVFFVLLHGDFDMLEERISNRTGHYMPKSLLKSQIDLLEPLDMKTEAGMVVEAGQPPEAIVRDIVDALTKKFGAAS